MAVILSLLMYHTNFEKRPWLVACLATDTPHGNMRMYLCMSSMCLYRILKLLA